MNNTRRRSRSRSPIRRDRKVREKRAIDPHSDKMIYLSNLPFELKWNELKDLIRQKVGETAYVEFLDDKDGRPKGCAVLDFDSRVAAQRCIDTMHRMDIQGRNITAKEIRDPMAFFRHLKNNDGIDFLANRNLIANRSSYRPRRERDDSGALDNETYGLSPTFLAQLSIKPPLVSRVFVTNIPFTCGVGKLYDVFALAGRITWFDLQLDNEGKSKGMAVVQYSHPIEAVQAISMLNNQRLFDRILSVKMDRFEEVERAPGELPAGLRAIGMGLGSGGTPLANVASVLSSLANVSGGGAMAVSQPTVQPFVQPISASNSFSNQSFPHATGYPGPNPSLNGSFSNNSMNMTTSGNEMGAYNQPQPQQVFKNEQQAPFKVEPQPAQQFSNQQAPSAFTNNSYYNNAPSQPINNGPPMNPGGFNSNSNYTKMSPQVNSSYGHQQQQQQNKPYYDNQPSRVILIKNLPMDYTWQIVSDRVSKFGEVENVEIISPGVAKIRYCRVADAERTKAQLSGTTVEGRIIAIEYL